MKPRIIIVLDGGLIRNVMSTCDIDIAIVDYDTEGIPDEDLTTLHFDTGDDRAYCFIERPAKLPEEVNRLYNIIEIDVNKSMENEQ